MPNMSLQKHPMPEQQPDIRATNFKEVALGYTREIAMEEADRCLHCKNAPCVKGCPVNVPIPDFIAHIKKGEFQEAYETIRLQNGLPAICGRVCPQETQCESKCVRGIKGEPVAIGRLERFAADYAMTEGTVSAETAAPTGKKAAVVGSGPAGLTCAADLAFPQRPLIGRRGKRSRTGSRTEIPKNFRLTQSSSFALKNPRFFQRFGNAQLLKIRKRPKMGNIALTAARPALIMRPIHSGGYFPWPI